LEFDRRGETIRDFFRGDAKEKGQALDKFPEITEQDLINSLVELGYGNLEQILRMIKDGKAGYLSKLLRVRAIRHEVLG